MPLTPSETVNMRLMVLRTGVTRFKMQYHDISKGLRIRSDNFHGYSHIDIELPGRSKSTVGLRDITEDSSMHESYEFIINYILQIAERNDNPLAGVIYWLSPALILPYNLLLLFCTLRDKYKPLTSLTTIARFIQIDIVNHVESGRKLRSYDYQNMIKNKFEWISKEEEKDGMQLPLNVIGTKYSSAIAARSPGAFVKFKGYNETSGIIKDVAPAAYLIDLRKDEHKNSKDVEVRYYDSQIDKD